MGSTGPCGPCSEIHIDLGPEACDMKHIAGHKCSVNCGCARYIELWNLVFIQYNRLAVLQGKSSNYDTDLFMPIINAISEMSGFRFTSQLGSKTDNTFRVIADHIRSLTFSITDGVTPSNEGRGYVMRRILRRACRFGRNLNMTDPFMYKLVDIVAGEMGQAFPEVKERAGFVAEVIKSEEESFGRTLDRGLELFASAADEVEKAGAKTISGESAFQLYDTFGFPLDLTQLMARERGLDVDTKSFDKCMAQQRQQSKAGAKGSSLKAALSGVELPETEDAEKYVTSTCSAKVLGWITKDGFVSTGKLEAGDKRIGLVLDRTCFYAESGGQVGDIGIIERDSDFFEVWDTQKPLDDLFTHIGKVKKGTFTVGDTVDLKTDEGIRRAIEANHSGTHILQAALKRVLGDHIKQSGSLVNAERLRFDFTHFAKIEEGEIEEVEHIANAYILNNVPVDTRVLEREEAMKTGATAVFDEKYGDDVRVVRMGDYSMELCGGTHVLRTGDIGFLKIVGESSIAAGVRRIEAVTGGEAVKYAGVVEKELKASARLVKAVPLELNKRVEKLLKTQKDLEREIEALKGKLAAKDSSDLLDKIKEIKGVKVLASMVDVPDVRTLRDFGDKVRDKISSGIVLLGSRVDDKAMLLCIVTKDLTDRYNAGKIIREIAPVVGGKGGGRPDMAQAGGSKPEKLKEALEKVEEILLRS